MTRISRRPVKSDVMERIFELFFQAIGKKSKKDDFFAVISDILSPTEKVMIAKRVTIIFLLMKKIDYQTISEVVKVASGTIAKFQIIMENSKGIVKSLQSSLLNDKLINILDEFMLSFKGPGMHGTNWTSAWKRKNELERRKSQGI